MLVLDEQYICYDIDISGMVQHIDGRKRGVAHGYGGHYRLFMSIAEYYSGEKFIDLGTHYGGSALAMGCNRANNIETYDVDVSYQTEVGATRFHIERFDNITFHESDALLIPSREYDDAKLIFLDLHPHDGIKEAKVLRTIARSKFSGILIMDDIDSYGLNKHGLSYERLYWLYRKQERPKEIIEFAHSLYSKYDSCGTGLISYGEKVKIVYNNGKTVTLG